MITGGEAETVYNQTNQFMPIGHSFSSTGNGIHVQIALLLLCAYPLSNTAFMSSRLLKKSGMCIPYIAY